MRLPKTTVGFLLLAAWPFPAVSQQPERDARLGRIVITLRDSVGRDSLVRGSVCTSIGEVARCAQRTTATRFTIPDLPAGTYTVNAACLLPRNIFGKALGQVALRVTDSVPVEREMTVAFAGCDTRQLRHVVGTMSGIYYSAFEAQLISPCRPSDWFVASDTNRSVWIHFAGPNAMRGLKWPKGRTIYVSDENGKRFEDGNTFFVRVHGTLMGPGHYGHMGSTAYEFIADSVEAVKTPGKDDCKREVVPRRAADALERRADSLIARLLATPGEIVDAGSGYAFITDQQLLDDLAALELHAVPKLIDCLSDTRRSRVVAPSPETDRAGRISRGAVCAEALIATHFFQMRDKDIFAAAMRVSGCDETANEGPTACYAYHYSKADELHRAQRVWREYLAAYRREGRTPLPRLGQIAVGCYSMRLGPPLRGTAILDTSLVSYFELDTIPFPGAVRLSSVRLSADLSIGGIARWKPHYESTVLVSWTNPRDSTRLGISFAGSDSAVTGYIVSGPSGDGTHGKVAVTGVECAGAKRERLTLDLTPRP